VDLEPEDDRREMSEPGLARGSRIRQRILVGAVGIVTVATVGLVAVNALALGGVTQQVQDAQSRAASLGNAMRESLVVLQLVTALGETSDSGDVTVHRGLLGRQLDVSFASFPPDAPEAREIAEVKAALARFPWKRLPRVGGHDDPLRLSAMALTYQVEQRVNALRSAEEQRFYATTIQALDANQRSQVGLGVLVALVLGLGASAVLVITRRSRSDIARAYQALRASEGRFRSLVQRASDLTVVTDRHGMVTYISPAAEALLGVPPDDLLEGPCSPTSSRASGPPSRTPSRSWPSSRGWCTRSSCTCSPATAGSGWSRPCAGTSSTTLTSAGWCGTGVTSPSGGRWRTSSPGRRCTTR
jgi:PAS domain-containing protein